MSKSKKTIIYGLLIIIILLFSIFLLTSKHKSEDTFTNTQKIEENNTQKEIIEETKIIPQKQTIEKGIQTILKVNDTKYVSEINKATSVYDFMNQLKNEGKITFKEKNYSGIGKFIQEINGLKSNGDNYWIYYINGVEASIGVSNYKINPGDIVSWKYEKNKY